MFVELASLAEEKCCNEIVMIWLYAPCRVHYGSSVIASWYAVWTAIHVHDLCLDNHVILYCFLVCLIIFVFIMQLLVQFTCMCMFNINHCHKTPISWIPTAQTIAGDVMCQSSDNQLVSS